MTTLREAALRVLAEHDAGFHGLPLTEALEALRAALAEPLVMQVRPSQFVELIKGKETMTGIPAYWSEWPNKEAP